MKYHRFNVLRCVGALVNALPVAVFGNLVFQPHFHPEVRNLFDEKFHHHLIGPSGPRPWPHDSQTSD